MISSTPTPTGRLSPRLDFSGKSPLQRRFAILPVTTSTSGSWATSRSSTPARATAISTAGRAAAATPTSVRGVMAGGYASLHRLHVREVQLACFQGGVWELILGLCVGVGELAVDYRIDHEKGFVT